MTKSLTEYLKEIGDETVSIVVDGQSRIVTRTEALARKMFLMAQGGIEEMINNKGEVVQVVHKPDHRVAKSIREFIEGKAAQAPAPEKKLGLKPGQFSSETARRLKDRLGGRRPMRPKKT